jgi:membrane-associated PAP2 superfamily phosphatase
LVFAFLPIFRTIKEHPERFYILLGIFFLLSLTYILYLEMGSFPMQTADELANLTSAKGNAYKLIGSLVGLGVMYLLDHKLWHYETRAPWLAQILKLLLGAAVVMGVKVLLKNPLLALTGGHASAGAIRYFLMFAVGGACPGLFPYITRFSLFLTKKCKKKKA